MQKLELWILKSAILDVETIPALEHLMENVLSYIVQRRSCAISFEKKTQFERLSNPEFLCEGIYVLFVRRKAQRRKKIAKNNK